MALAKSVGGGTGLDLTGALPGQDIRVDALSAALEYHRRAFYPETYGAVGDGQKVLDGAITASGTTATSATGSFASDDVGKAIIITGAGAAGANLVTTIASFTSTTEVETTASASTTVSAANVVWGTDDTAAFQAAIDAANTAGNGNVIVDRKRYLFVGVLELKRGVGLVGISTELLGMGQQANATDWNPDMFDVAPTLMIIDEVTEFIKTAEWGIRIRGLYFTYPSQPQPDAGTAPTVYPYTIYCERLSAGVVIKNCVFMNSYDAIKMYGSGHNLSDLLIGNLQTGILFDYNGNFTNVVNIEFIGVWDLIWGLTPGAFPGSTFTAFRDLNSLNLDIYRADGIHLMNIGSFRGHTGMRMYETTDPLSIGSPLITGWGHATNIEFDVIKFGIRMKGGYPTYHEWRFANLTITGDPTNGADTGIWLEAGGNNTPKLRITGGGIDAPSSFSSGVLVVDDGYCAHDHVESLSDVFNTFADGDATPDVTVGGSFQSANTTPVTITTLDNPYNGQEIPFIFGDTNTTINETGNIKLNGVTSLIGAVGDGLLFKYDGVADVFYQIGGGGASPLTTKGDLFTYDTGNARLPIGTDGEALVADSAETTGLRWTSSVEAFDGGAHGDTYLNTVNFDGGTHGL